MANMWYSFVTVAAVALLAVSILGGIFCSFRIIPHPLDQSHTEKNAARFAGNRFKFCIGVLLTLFALSIIAGGFVGLSYVPDPEQPTMTRIWKWSAGMSVGAYIAAFRIRRSRSTYKVRYFFLR